MLDRWLGRDRIIAGSGFNRWLIPPAALAIHLCIGMAYGFSVFWLPLSRALVGHRGAGGLCGGCVGVDLSAQRRRVATGRSLACSAGPTRCSSSLLGSAAAALFGHWLETAGPRKAGFVAALCWSGGLLRSARWACSCTSCGCCGWVAGVLGGIGLGLGYISPVSTLIKWFPDRRGMATGLAIMGFGGWRDDRLAAGGSADAALRHPHVGGCGRPLLVTLALDLSGGHAAGRLRLSRAARRAGRLPGWTPPPPSTATTQDHAACERGPRVRHSAVLAAVGRAVPERERRHRRRGHGLADAAGSVRRQAAGRRWRAGAAGHRPARAGGHHRRGVRGAAVAVQHLRPHLLGIVLRCHRPQDHVFRLLRCWASRSMPARPHSAERDRWPCSWPRSASS